jgi:hypothetical protein
MRKMYMDRLAACRENILKHRGEMGIMRKKGVVIHKEMEDQREEVRYLLISSGVFNRFFSFPSLFHYLMILFFPHVFSIPFPLYHPLSLARPLPLQYAVLTPFLFFVTTLSIIFSPALLYCTIICALNNVHKVIITSYSTDSSSHSYLHVLPSSSLSQTRSLLLTPSLTSLSSSPLHRPDHYKKEKANCAVR